MSDHEGQSGSVVACGASVYWDGRLHDGIPQLVEAFEGSGLSPFCYVESDWNPPSSSWRGDSARMFGTAPFPSSVGATGC
jgi:hypothetical protein